MANDARDAFREWADEMNKRLGPLMEPHLLELVGGMETLMDRLDEIEKRLLMMEHRIVRLQIHAGFAYTPISPSPSLGEPPTTAPPAAEGTHSQTPSDSGDTE